ncbi:MAG: hypothetical protein ACYTHM_06285 [Planctomycetota bacterium]|jgi:hypothetical protein
MTSSEPSPTEPPETPPFTSTTLFATLVASGIYLTGYGIILVAYVL